MDLSELLSPERIRCQCHVKSKKRALQTLAEMLNQSLIPTDDTASEPDAQAESGGTIGTLASKLLKTRPKDDGDSDKGVLSEMGILDAFISRERLGNTCLDYGFALPHSRIGFIDKPIAAMITLDEGIDFNANDHQAVDLVLGLLVPEQCNDEHLQILAKVARRFSDEQFRAALRAFTRPEEVHDYLTQLTSTDQ